jgi:hypothetical protein
MVISHAMIRVMRDADFPGRPYAWVITRDRNHELSEGAVRSEVGTCGPALATPDMFDRARSEGRRWRLYDEGDIDDCTETGLKPGHPEYGMYYEGVIWAADGPGGDEDFGPLDDFGRPNDGCTEIRYLEDGKWVTL